MMFSIIIPSYGQAKYLRDAIESSLSQTYTDFEVIVVDDGSTDGSLAIAEEYEPRITVIKQVNKGLASARNAGIMSAKGDYIVPLDADDRLMPKFLSEASYYTDSHMTGLGRSFPVKDIIAPSIRCINEETGQQHDTILIEDPTLDDFKEGNRLAYCAAIRRDILLEVGGYSPKMDALGGWEDLHLWYNLLTRGKEITTLKEPLLLYRMKADSMWKRTQGNEKALWAQIVKDFPQVKDHAKA